jgi:hypothetical protein
MVDCFNFTPWEYADIAVHMYVFAEAYDIARLQSYLQVSTIQKAHINTRPGNVLRELLVDGYIEFGAKDVAALMALPKQFLVDVLGKAAREG